MKFILDKDTLTIEENKFYNSGSVDYYEAEVQFDETWNDLTIEAIITKMGENKGISRSPINNKIMLDLQENGTYTVGFVGYKIENEEKIYQISTNLGVIQYNQGAGEIETENEELPTPTEWEIYIAQIQDMIDNIQTDYIPLRNKPKINNIELTGNKSLHELGIQREGNYALEEDIPTTLAELSEDSTHRTVTDIEKTTWNNKSDFSGSYNDLTDKPTIPDELKDLSDDSTHRTVTDTEKTTWNNKAEVSDIPDVSSFITKDVNNLTNYTLKTNTGSLIDLEINQTTYVVTLSLKDQDGNVISTDTIDLPLENVVVSGSYDSTNQKIVLTLQSGDTVDIPVGALVSGLQSEITSQNKLASDLVDDTNSGNKFVTTSEKQTWNNKYDKPNGGIPKTDLASDVQTSLGKADTALQEHQDISGKEDKTNKVTSIDNTSTDTQYPSAKCVHDSQEEQNTEIEKLQTENARLKATLPTTTGEGQDITLDKTAEMDFVKPPLPRGNTKQDTTTGKNLWNDEIVTVAPSDKVIKNNNEYLFGLIGQSTSEVITLPFILNEDHTYTISFDAYADEDGTRLMIDGNPDSIYNAQGIPDIAISISSQNQRISRTISLLNGNTTIRFYRTSAHPKATTSRIYLSNIQLEEGSTATSYEPYTGGIPSPSPDYPQEVEVVTGNVEVTISNENNTQSKTLPVSLGNIELCKIGNYQDYLYKNNGKWYKYGAIRKLTITSISSVGTASTGIKYALVGSVSIASASSFIYCSNYANSTSATKNNTIRLSGTNLYVYDNRFTDYTTALNLLNGLEYYCVLATPTSTEITDVTLISQLEEISKTLSYQGQTNITSNTIALFDVEAYQSTKLVLEEMATAIVALGGV